MIGSSVNGKGTIKACKESMESRRSAEKDSGHIAARILVVGGDEVERSVLESLLIQTGHQVQGCLTSQEATRKLRDGSFDLIIMDVKTAGVDGLDVLREAKELDPFSEVVVITACGSGESAVEATKLGAYDCIARPFNAHEIRKVVDAAIGKRRLARADGLTVEYDDSGFNALLEAEIGRSQRHLRPLSLLMMSLDEPKEYHETLGQPPRDAIPKQVASLLKKSLRKCDVVTRYRDNEFAIILVETSKVDATDTANRLRRLVEESSFEHYDVFAQRNHTVTVSIGTASYPTDAVEKLGLVTKADQALSEAKTLGGNLVRSAGQELALMGTYHEKWLYFLCKRCMDIILSFLCLVIALPLFLLIALLIKMDSSGPVFFKQERVGLRKRSIRGKRIWEFNPFSMFKFRTMYHSCDRSMHWQFIRALIRDDGGEGEQLWNNSDSVVKKLSKDPRITQVGKVLRKTTMDEWPQLWNVLKGEMSLVGPRPPIVYELAQYEPHHWRRLETIPGCTGLWQVSGWNALGFEEMVELDVWYVQHQSLWLDIKILLGTVPAMLLGKGGG